MSIGGVVLQTQWNAAASHPTSQKTDKRDMIFDGTNISLEDSRLEPFHPD